MRKIVSLTSYGERVKRTLPKTLKSIHRIDGFDPDKILLYLTEQDAALLDDSVLRDNPDVTVVTVPDIKSFKKYYALTNREYNDDIVFITDDDIVHDKNTWTSLNSIYESNPDDKCIYAKGCTILKATGKYGVPDDTEPNERFLFWSGCGLLIPPHVMRMERETLDCMYDYILKNRYAYVSDDKFMSIYAQTRGIKCRCAYTKQHYLDFTGNVRLMDLRRGKGKSRLHWQQAARYFKLEDRDRITVSLAPVRLNADRLESLFTKQTLKPDKVIVILKPDTKVSDKVGTLADRYNIDIQYDSNPYNKRWIPDTDPNDLLFVMDDTEHPDTQIEEMYTEYYSTDRQAYSHVKDDFIYTPEYGHRHRPDLSRTVVRRRHTDGLDTTSDDLQLELTKTVLTQLINNP